MTGCAAAGCRPICYRPSVTILAPIPTSASTAPAESFFTPTGRAAGVTQPRPLTPLEVICLKGYEQAAYTQCIRTRASACQESALGHGQCSDNPPQLSLFIPRSGG